MSVDYIEIFFTHNPLPPSLGIEWFNDLESNSNKLCTYMYMTRESESSESYFLFFTSNNMFTLLTYIISKNNFIDVIKFRC